MLFSPLVCGSDFHHQEEEEKEEEEEELEVKMMSQPSTPRRCSRKSIGIYFRSKKSKNPYSNRGLDKFSELLANLDEKRQKIYTQKGSKDISYVRFVYSKANSFKPIVVKSRNATTTNGSDSKTNVVESGRESSDNDCPVEVTKIESEQRTVRKMDNWRRPSNYLPVIIVLILFLIAVFGKSFAVLCMSTGWYLLPIIRGGRSVSNRLKKRKNYEYYRSR